MSGFAYSYSIANDTANGVLNINSFVSEINQAISNGDINQVLNTIEGGVETDGFDVIFRGELTGAEQVALNTVVAAHTGVALPTEGDKVYLNESRDPLGRLLVATDKKAGVGLIVSTHNFCDPTTWYTKSVRVTDESLSDAGGNRFDFANNNIIDLKHGKIFNENKIILMGADGYDLVVRVDGVVQTEKPLYGNASYDYEAFYADGYIVFNSPPAGLVTASYSYATTSEWFLVPEPGKSISIRDAEIQFGEDIVLNDVLHFDAVYNEIMVLDRETYKTETDFIDQATGTFPVIERYGAMPARIFGFPFRYNTVRILSSSQSVSLCLRLGEDRPYNGYRAVATFYCTVEDETS